MINKKQHDSVTSLTPVQFLEKGRKYIFDITCLVTKVNLQLINFHTLQGAGTFFLEVEKGKARYLGSSTGGAQDDAL